MAKALLTIATGKPVYIQIAAALARSFRLWNRDNGIEFFLATDHRASLPRDLHFVRVIPLTTDQFGGGFSSKLYLNRLAAAEQTLFVDADCLCVGDLGPVFDRFAGQAVSVIGRPINGGEWFGDVATICARFGVASIPRFNGGLYYVEPGATADRVYEQAQEIERHYDDFGFLRLRGRPNDEVVMAVAMARAGQVPIPDDGTIMNSTLAAPGGVEVDVLSGKSRLSNPIGHPAHNDWYELEEMRPLLIHFLGAEISGSTYRREEVRLARVMAGWPRWAARMWAAMAVSFPLGLKARFTSLFRPVYRRLRGNRAVHEARSRT